MERHREPRRSGRQITVTVHADSADGFDKGKLQNGVFEPLRESDLIK